MKEQDMFGRREVSRAGQENVSEGEETQQSSSECREGI